VGRVGAEVGRELEAPVGAADDEHARAPSAEHLEREEPERSRADDGAVSPAFGAPRATARTTTASGSVSSRSSSATGPGAGQQHRDGTRTSSAKPPSTSIPTAVRARQRFRFPSRQSAHPPHEKFGSITTRSPVSVSRPTSSWPMTRG